MSPTGPWKRASAAASLLAALLGCRSTEPPSVEARAVAARMQPGRYEREGYAYPLAYRLFVPDGYDASRSYPLVLFLHAWGGNGGDGVKHLGGDVATLISEPVQSIARSFVLAPQCPVGDEWVNRHDHPPFRNYVQANVRESDALRMTLEVLEQVATRFNVDRARVYVTGFSMGGSGTWDVITRHPDVFAAAVPVTGVNDPSRAAAIATLPIWAFHGANDEVSPVANTRAMTDALRALGSPVRYTELAGVGHGSCGPAYASMDMYRWMFAQRRGAVAAR